MASNGNFGLARRNAAFVSALVGLLWAVGCGDETLPGDDGAGTGASAGKGGGSGKGGSAGSSSDPGTGGDPGSGGSAGEAPGAGSGGEPQGGAAGEGGTGGDPVVFGDIEEVGDELHDFAHDLRGLTYSASGKIYASGYTGATYGANPNTEIPDDRQIVVARFNADGTLDDGFATDGVAQFNLVERTFDDAEVMTNDGNEESLGIVELANGDLVLQVNLRGEAGAGQDVGLFKIDADGDPVAAFGDDRGIDGLTIVDFGWTDADNADWPASGAPSDTAWGVSLDSSGAAEKLVLNGFGPAAHIPTPLPQGTTQRTDNDRYIVRVLASDGSVDPDFNGNKPFTLAPGVTLNDNGRRAIVEADGSIVSGGYTNFTGLGNHVVLIRLLPTGLPDESFGFGIGLDGVAAFNPFENDGGAAECYSVARQASGRYVTTGYGSATKANKSSSYGYATTTAQDLVSFGILPGELDLEFGNQGTVAIQSEEHALGGTEDRGRDLAVLPDQRIVQVGRFGTSPAIFVLTPDGEMATDVGTDGRFDYEPLAYTDEDGVEPDLSTGTSHFYRVAVSSDGKRIAATTNNHPNGVRLAILEVSDP